MADEVANEANEVAGTGANGVKEKRYRIREIFRTIQGEGVHAGRDAVFVRFVACNMWSGYDADRERDARRTGAWCPLWCDTLFTKEGSAFYTAAGVADEVEVLSGGGARHVVLTGGEPLLQADSLLVGALQDRGFYVAVETNGTVRLSDAFDAAEPDWVTVSPKLPDALTLIEACDEVKLVVPDYRPEDYERLRSRGRHGLPVLWVQPEDGPRYYDAAQTALAYVRSHGARLSVQGHKVVGAP